MSETPDTTRPEAETPAAADAPVDAAAAPAADVTAAVTADAAPLTPEAELADAPADAPAAPADPAAGSPEPTAEEAPAATGQPVVEEQAGTPGDEAAPAPGAVAPGEQPSAEQPAGDQPASGEQPAGDQPASGEQPAPVVDPAEAARLKEEVLAEAEAVAATPDRDEDGKAPDDRALTERLRALEARWRQAGNAGEAEAGLRQRWQEARTAYATARSRRAELRAVERARAGETKRALLVEAFALSQLAQGTTLAQLAAGRAGTPEQPAEPPAAQAEQPAAEPAAEQPAEQQVADEPAASADPVTETAEAEQPEAAEAPGEPAAEEAPVVAEAPEAPAAETPAEPANDGAEAPAEVADEPAASADPVAETAEAEQPEAAEPEAAETAEAEQPEAAEPAAEAAEAEQLEAAEQPEAAEGAGDEAAPGVPAEAPAAPEASTEAATGPGTVDITALARRARELQEEWTQAGYAGREVESELQPLFRRYLQVVFDKQRKESGTKVAARRELVAAARALAEQAGAEGITPGQVQRLVREAKQLQTRWKEGEAAPRAAETGAWRQFSGALREVFVVREKLSEGARAEREDIIAKAQALAGGRDPMRAVRDLGPLLRRWREAGPVPTAVYEELKTKLDQAASSIREKADTERRRRDAEDAKSSAERSKNASRIIREAERQRRPQQGRRPERPASAAAQGALAAALADAFGRAERVAAEVRQLEQTVAQLRERLQQAEAGELQAREEQVATDQGFTVRRQSVDPGAVNPTRLRTELQTAEQALTRRRAELDELTSSARGLGLTG